MGRLVILVHSIASCSFRAQIQHEHTISSKTYCWTMCWLSKPCSHSISLCSIRGSSCALPFVSSAVHVTQLMSGLMLKNCFPLIAVHQHRYPSVKLGVRIVVKPVCKGSSSLSAGACCFASHHRYAMFWYKGFLTCIDEFEM